MATLAELSERLGDALLELRGDPSIEVVDAVLDSRQVRPRSLFCCVPGGTHDGHDFAAAAVAAGAGALLVERALELPVAQLVVDDARRRTGQVAAALCGDPARRLALIGVTGTNGKTTVTSVVGAALTTLGYRCGVIGTLTGAFTTPEAPDLQRQLADFAAAGCTHVVMEVSSHALALARVEGCHFAVAAFTNLGRDHLDFHPTVEDYFAAKATLFAPALTDCAVINVDDEHGAALAATVRSAGAPALVEVSAARVTDATASATEVRFGWDGVAIHVPLGGRFNIGNVLLAAEVLAALGESPSRIAAALAETPPVPGRFESIEAGQRFAVVVDFAHTPDGLTAVLDAVGDTAGRRIVVFGAGGNRDRAKRPLMAAAVARRADVIVVTSDNPRDEDPEAIINDVLQGIPEGYGGRVMVVPDRRSALATAFAEAGEGDVVVIAGRGHERRQQIKGGWREFHDPTVAREELEKLT